MEFDKAAAWNPPIRVRFFLTTTCPYAALRSIVPAGCHSSSPHRATDGASCQAGRTVARASRRRQPPKHRGVPRGRDRSAIPVWLRSKRPSTPRPANIFFT